MKVESAPTASIAARIDAVVATHELAVSREPAARRALAGLRAVATALESDSPLGAAAFVERMGAWVEAIDAALAGEGGAVGRRDARAIERIADVQRQLDDQLIDAVERADPVWRAAWLARVAPEATPADPASPPHTARATVVADGERERARFILAAVLSRAGLAPWDESLDPSAIELAPDGAIELAARTVAGEDAGELVRARVAPACSPRPSQLRDALGYAVGTTAAHRGRSLDAWLATAPPEAERAHLAFALVEDALGASAPGAWAPESGDSSADDPTDVTSTTAPGPYDRAPPDPDAIRVGGLASSPVPVGEPGAGAGSWDAWSAMLDRLDVAQARFEDLPANLEPLADRLAAAIAATPRWQLGRLGERSVQVRAWFTRLAQALGDLDRDSRSRGWPLRPRAARVDSGALDVAMGDPNDAVAQRRTIAEELIPFYARPYQIALMGVFSSGKTLLINKLLLAMSGLPLAPYSPDPPYRQDPRYAVLKPYLRRSTAEPTDTVVTILRAPRVEDDPAEVRELLALIATSRPAYPTDPVELPVPLTELETMNLIDTPGLNEDLSVNRRVGAFLQSCDLIVYVFSATGVMNSQDHFLIRRLHDVAPKKRMIFAINMIDTLVNRVAHTAFWDSEHEKAVVRASLPLRARIKQEVSRLTGVEPPLVLGQDFWVTSGAYDYQVEALYRHLRSLIERTAALDRLRATPGILRTHLRWARDFARVHLERDLRPRLRAVDGALASVRELFERQLPRRMDEDKEQALVQFARRHALPDPVFPTGPAGHALLDAPEEPPVPWGAFRGLECLTIGEGGTAGALAALLEDTEVIEAWTRAVTDGALAQKGYHDLGADLARFDRALGAAGLAAHTAIRGAFDAFADALLPSRIEAAGTALGREIVRRCAALSEELDGEYQRRWGIAFGAPGSCEEPAARALVGTPAAAGGAPESDPLAAPRRALADRVDSACAELAHRSAELAGALALAPTRVAETLAVAVQRMRDGAALRPDLDLALARRAEAQVLRRGVRVVGAVGAGLLVSIGALAAGWASVALTVLAVGGGGAGWWWDRRTKGLEVARHAALEATLARNWEERAAGFDRELERCRADVAARAADWGAAAREIGEAAVASGHVLAHEYRSSVRGLFQSGSLAPWLLTIEALAMSRTRPLEVLRERIADAIAGTERAQESFATGELADEAAAIEVLARAHDRHARAGSPGGQVRRGV